MSSADALNKKFGALHKELKQYFPFVVHISVALYDPKTDDIKTFLYSPGENSPLTHYRTKLSKAGWLDSLRHSHRSRVIDELDSSVLGNQTHSQRIGAAKYKSSYTAPLWDGKKFLGFVFFDADQRHVFSERVTRQLDLFVKIIALMVENALRSLTVLTGGLHLLREISRFRDDETSDHLIRMSYYSELIAREIAGELGRDDEWVEYVRLFAPLHDIGKITTPDSILFKPGELDGAEAEVIRQHAARGEEILRAMIRSLELEQIPHIEGLLHIARHHHECWDGTGYPDGLKGDGIPAEARIVKVSDVFDALTSTRCYKPAWPLERAEAFLQAGAGLHFDPRCVEVFLAKKEEILNIRKRAQNDSSEAT